jgi:hypothetical protein
MFARRLTQLVVFAAFSSAPLAYAQVSSTTFASGLESWTSNAGVSWQSAGGNGGGYLRFVDPGSAVAGDIFAPVAYLGDWRGLDGGGRLQYDFRLFQVGTGTPFAPRVRLTGPGGTARWRGPVPSGAGGWTTLVANIEESAWTVESGSWSAILANVTTLSIAMAVVNNQGFPTEITGVDNISVQAPVAVEARTWTATKRLYLP